jgi:protein-S-isoprenylcysteine O-methyltransferase Ste14
VPVFRLRDEWPIALGSARFAGAPLIAVGGAGLLWCISDFARIGRGTLAPVDPPSCLVRRGLYAYVRNPMYVSVLVILAGETLLLESLAVLAWLGVAALAFHLFVLLYEEPALQRTFGADYEAYRRAVPRWVPRVRCRP